MLNSRDLLLSIVGVLVSATLSALHVHENTGDGIVFVSPSRPELRDLFAPEHAQINIVSTGHLWAEGPLWHPDGFFLFSDVKKNHVVQIHPNGSENIFRSFSGCYNDPPRCSKLYEPGSNGLVIDSKSGRLVACQHGERRVVALGAAEDGTKDIPLADSYQGKKLNSPNDAIFTKAGMLIFTDPSYGLVNLEEDDERELEFNGVYYVPAEDIQEKLQYPSRRTPQPRRLKVPPRLNRPNGLALSPDEKLIYFANSNYTDLHWEVCSLPELIDGSYESCREFANGMDLVQPTFKGSADGLKVDSHGNVWATGPGGLHVFRPDGAHLGALLTGSRTGNVAFGPDEETIYVAADSRVILMKIEN